MKMRKITKHKISKPDEEVILKLQAGAEIILFDVQYLEIGEDPVDLFAVWSMGAGDVRFPRRFIVVDDNWKIPHNAVLRGSARAYLRKAYHLFELK